MTEQNVLGVSDAWSFGCVLVGGANQVFDEHLEAMTDVSWLDWPGYFHNDQMRVTERLRREGNTLHYQATVEDPVVLMKPWVRNPIVRPLNTDPNATFLEDPPCDERDLEHLVTKERG